MPKAVSHHLLTRDMPLNGWYHPLSNDLRIPCPHQGFVPKPYPYPINPKPKNWGEITNFLVKPHHIKNHATLKKFLCKLTVYTFNKDIYMCVFF